MRTSFHHQPEAQHPKFFSYPQAAGRLPHLSEQQRTWLDLLMARPGRERPISGHRDAFAERHLWNVTPRPAGQSALMPVNFTTLPHFSVSSAMSFPKSAGEPTSGAPPKSVRRAFSLGSARLALISLLSCSTIAAGVAFGAPTPKLIRLIRQNEELKQ